MKTLISTITAIALSGMLFVSCNNSDDISSLLDNNELSSSSETIDTTIVSSSSGITTDSTLCDGKEYNPETHFCYIDGCAQDPNCEACKICLIRETLAEKCNGKIYDPNTEECFQGNFVVCRGQGQILECGGCIQFTTCDGNPATYKDGTPVKKLCYATDNCNLSSSSEDKSSSSVIDSLLCENKEYDRNTHFCDERDGKVYKFTSIGNQTWMAQNLNYNSPGSVCYEPHYPDKIYYDCDENEGAYRLYDVGSILNAIYRNCTMGVNCIGEYVCPTGWHVPTDEEWIQLTEFVNGDAAKLKATDWQGTDDYGFAARSGTYLVTRSDIMQVTKDIGTWWSSTEPYWECPVDTLEYEVDCLRPPLSAYIRQISSNSDEIFREVGSERDVNAIRCILD